MEFLFIFLIALGVWGFILGVINAKRLNELEEKFKTK